MLRPRVLAPSPSFAQTRAAPLIRSAPNRRTLASTRVLARRSDSVDASRPAARRSDSVDAPRPAARRSDSVDAPRPAASVTGAATPSAATNEAVQPTSSPARARAQALRGASCPTQVVGRFSLLTGRIENRELAGLGGEAPPSGPYLLLERPIRVEGQLSRELYVDSGASFTDGAEYTLSGRLDRVPFGGVESEAQSVLGLSGVSNVRPGGEPRYDGSVFLSSNEAGWDEPLLTLFYDRPQQFDEPATIFVVDPRARKAFIGSHGGFIMPEVNPFHGFRGWAPIEDPTPQDRANVTFASGQPVTASGEALVQIGGEGEHATYPDALSTRWFYSDRERTAYAFQSGGFAGFRDRMSAVIRQDAITPSA